MKSKLHTYVTVSISNYKAIFTYTINVVVATNHTDQPVVWGPGYILKMGGYAVMQPMQEHMQDMQTPWGQFTLQTVDSYVPILGIALLGYG